MCLGNYYFLYVAYTMLKLALEHLPRTTMYKLIQEVTLCGSTVYNAEIVHREAHLVYEIETSLSTSLLRFLFGFSFLFLPPELVVNLYCVLLIWAVWL